MEIREYRKADERAVIELIVGIQRGEFQVPVTAADQPDLLDVKAVYQSGAGNFWVAVSAEAVVGTIALIDIGNHQAALRKMFVRKDFRGVLGQRLLETALAWCRENEIREIYLGTVDRLEAARKFYLRNGFVLVEKGTLPRNFPVMAVDNRFYALKL